MYAQASDFGEYYSRVLSMLYIICLPLRVNEPLLKCNKPFS